MDLSEVIGVFAIDVPIPEPGLPPVWFQVTQSVLLILTSMLMVLSTLALAVEAVYGEWLRNRFLPARLAITLDSDLGHYIERANRYYFHLKIQNAGWTLARNCRVMLNGFSKRRADNRFHPVDMPFPIQLTWSPSEMPPPYRNISRSKPEMFDLGFIAKPDRPGSVPGFVVQAYVMPCSYADLLSVKAGEAARYYMSVEADNSLICSELVVEVSWDGVWHDDSHKFRDHLLIRVVQNEEP